MRSSARIRELEENDLESGVYQPGASAEQCSASLNPVSARQWLQLQSRMISGLRAAFVKFDSRIMLEGRETAISIPEDHGDLRELEVMVDMAGRNGAPLVSGAGGEASQSSSAPLRVAMPLRSGHHTVGAVAVELQAPLSAQIKVLQLLEWGEAWLGWSLSSGHPHDLEASEGLLSLYEQVAGQTDYRAAVLAAVNGLAACFSCERVSLGWRKSGSHQIDAVSNLVGYSERTTLLNHIREAMDEAVEQGGVVSWPGIGDQAASVAHAALGAENGGLTICTVPGQLDGHYEGALCFERRGGESYPDSRVPALTSAAGPLLTLLALRHARDRSWIGRIRNRFSRPGQPPPVSRWAAITVMGAFLMLALSLWQGDYRVAAPAALEGAVQRAVVAPFAGYVVEAPVRAGEQVHENQLLLRLEDKDISLEYQRLSSERSELQRQYRKALANLDHVQTRIYEAQQVQVGARLDMLQKQLERTRLVAPIGGVLISGDWSRSLGMPVERGQVLFEVAPLDSYRVAMELDDRDIAAIDIGQKGHLVLSALADRQVPLRVTNVTSMSSESGEGSHFRVEAEIGGAVGRLRPGMQGIAKVKVGERSILWLWTHRLVDWLRYQFWSLLP